MALLVHDEIWNAYVNPGTGAVPFDDASGVYLGQEVGTAFWGLVAGRNPPLVGRDQNGMLVQAVGRRRPGDGVANGASCYAKGAFTPDHFAECTHPPPIYSSALPASYGEAGPAVRMSPLADSAYVAYIDYLGPIVAGLDGFCSGNVWLTVVRYNAGVPTVIVQQQIDGWAHPQDHWYVQLQVWGQNPVHLRVITKAPTMYVPGQTSWTAPGGRLTSTTQYDHPTYGLIQVDQSDPSAFYFGLPMADWNTASVAPSTDLLVFQGSPNYTRSNPNRVWVVWEGTDASAGRLLSGSPGMRFQGVLFGGAKFTAGDLVNRSTQLTTPASVPATLDSTNASASTTATANGSSLDFANAQVAEWSVDAGPSSIFTITPRALGTGVASLSLYLNDVLQQTFNVGGTPMSTANRTSGVAPLAVFFDAADTVNEGIAGTPTSATSPPNWPFVWTSGVTQPADMEGAHWAWDFGDTGTSGQGTWANSGRSRNTATGYVAAHVYETPGTYVVTLLVTDVNGAATLYMQTITVSAFAGATHYAAATGTGDGTSESTPQSLSSGWSWVTGAAGRRLLLKRGDTFNLSGTLSIPTSRAGIIIGAYGTGARPVLSYGGGDVLVVNSPDVTIMDVDFTASSPADNYGIKGEPSQRQDRLLVLRSKITNHSMGILTDCYASLISNPNSGMVFQEMETDGANFGTTKIGIFVGGYQLAVLGCNAYNSTSHNIRLHTAAKAVVSHNRMGGSSSGSYQHALKIHASEFERSGSCESRWVVVSDNWATYPAPWVISIGPQNGSSVERVSHVVLERNRTLGDSGTARNQAGLEISARSVLMRNNILDGTGGTTGYTGALVQRRGIEPAPYDIRFLNNTVVRRDAVSTFSGVSFSNTDLAAVRNNIAWAPSGSSRTMVNGTPTNFTTQTNLAVGTDPLFTSLAGQDFTLQAGSPAVNAGTTRPEVPDDFTMKARTGANDIGAYER